MLGQVLDDLIVLEPNALYNDAVIAHELAHLWFGVLVPLRPGAAGRWTEGVSEYLAFWDLSRDPGAFFRRDRLHQYDAIDDEEDLALTSEVPISDASSDKLSYGKAMLLMEALEVRIGKDAVAAFLRALAERRRDQRTGWDELVQLLGELQGPEVAGWFREWIDRPGAPALELEGRRERDGQFHGAIVQTAHAAHPAGAAPFRGTVQVNFTSGDAAEPLLYRIELSGRRTELSLSIPPGARRVELDPMLRFPRHRMIRRANEDPHNAVTAIELGPPPER